MKVLYHIGETIGFDTIVKKGIFRADVHPMMIESKEGNIIFDDLKSVELFKLNGFGTMIKLQNGLDLIFATVPCIYIERGTGFAIINSFATKKLKHLLELNIDQ
jgi:hypothetical protein